MRENSLFRWILLALSGMVLMFIIAPLAGMFFHTGAADFFSTASESEVQKSIWLTIWVAFAGTLFFSIGAIPLAWFLARKNFPGKSIVQGIIDLPVVLPHTAAGIALLGFISREGFLGKVASAAGLDLVNHPSGIALAMAFVSLPFLINSAREGFASVPERLEKAALNLGAGQARVFFTISLPLAWRSIVSGFVMMFARGMSEFGAVVIIAYHPMVAPVLIYERFGSFGLKYARPAAVLFIIVALAVFVTLRLIPSGRKEKKPVHDAEAY
ncbi:MAG TPA: ABC transporter permease [Bacteroidales bacterium]|nr:ABC transporter permease [Bacteroidales bacterium]